MENKEIEKLLRKLLEEQSRLINEVVEGRKRIEEIEERLQKIEKRINFNTSSVVTDQLTPAHLKALKALLDLNKAVGTRQLAEHLNLSRNVVSYYLNTLERYGVVQRIPNIESKDTSSRYLFTANIDNLSEELRKLLETQK